MAELESGGAREWRSERYGESYRVVRANGRELESEWPEGILRKKGGINHRATLRRRSPISPGARACRANTAIAVRAG